MTVKRLSCWLAHAFTFDLNSSTVARVLETDGFMFGSKKSNERVVTVQEKENAYIVVSIYRAFLVRQLLSISGTGSSHTLILLDRRSLLGQEKVKHGGHFLQRNIVFSTGCVSSLNRDFSRESKTTMTNHWSISQAGRSPTPWRDRPLWVYADWKKKLYNPTSENLG